MLIRSKILSGIEEGRVTLAFRKWRKPTVKTGGRLRTKIGELAIDKVEIVNNEDITDSEAKAAGYESREELIKELNSRAEGDLYRIELHLAGPDPRKVLRERTTFEEGEFEELTKRLQRFDKSNPLGPWTQQFLGLIQEQPGRRAPELAEQMGYEKKKFKGNVRKLKELGLTESLKVGYRLSPRGEAALARLKKAQS